MTEMYAPRHTAGKCAVNTVQRSRHRSSMPTEPACKPSPLIWSPYLGSRSPSARRSTMASSSGRPMGRLSPTTTSSYSVSG